MRRKAGLAAVSSFLVLALGLAGAEAQVEPVPAVFPVTVKAPTLTAGKRYLFSFTLHDTAGDGVPLWGESRSYRLPATKRLRHRLGSVDPVGNPISPFLFQGQLWVEVSAAGKTFPRVRLGVVPYAVRSAAAGNLEGRIAAWQVDSGGAPAGDALVADGSGGAQWQAAAPGASGTVTRVDTGAGLAGGPITGTGTISVASGGIVGGMIATGAVTDAKITGPIATGKLSVGTTPGTVAAGDHGHPNFNADTVDGRHGSEFVLKAGDTMTGGLDLPANGLSVGVNQLALAGGRVGIGTAAPQTTLDVAGTVRGQAFEGDGSGLTGIRGIDRFMGRVNAIPAGDAVWYAPVLGLADATATESDVQTVLPSAGCLAQNLIVRTVPAPGSGKSVGVYLRANGAYTGFSCTVFGTSTECSNGQVAAIVGGSTLSLEIDVFDFTGTMPTLSVMFGWECR